MCPSLRGLTVHENIKYKSNKGPKNKPLKICFQVLNENIWATPRAHYSLILTLQSHVPRLTHSVDPLPHFHVLLLMFNNCQPLSQLSHHLFKLTLICTVKYEKILKSSLNVKKEFSLCTLEY